MLPDPTMLFKCHACSHEFQSTWEVVARQPSCPRCRTWGRIAGPDGSFVGTAPAPVMPAPQPAQVRAAPVRAPVPRPMRAPVARAAATSARHQGEVVTVGADVSYGRKGNSKSAMTALLIAGLGLGSLAVLYLIVTTLTKSNVEETRQKREVVLDVADFERAIDESVGRVRTLLRNIPGSEVVEGTNFGDAIAIIEQSGGTPPAWTEPPKPGQPFRAVGFVVTGLNPRVKKQDAGFVMLLYYKTKQETVAAAEEIRRQFGSNTTLYSISANPENWFVAYSGNAYGGAITDAMKTARSMGTPASYRQFTERVGATYKGRPTDG